MPARSLLSANVTPNEIVFSNAAIVVESRYPLDPESAQGGLVVRGLRGRVRVTRGGRVATSSTGKGLPAGHHVLIVDGLATSDHLDADGRPGSADLRQPRRPGRLQWIVGQQL